LDKEARAFLELLTPVLARVMTASAEADWLAARDDTPEHSGARRGAAQALAGVLGAPALLTKTKSFLAREDELSPVTARQLKILLSLAADAPGTLPDVIAERSSLEAEQTFLQEGPALCLLRTSDGHCRRPTRASEVDDILHRSRDLDLRARAWLATKDVGRSLKPGLARLQGLRNRIARELGFPSFWALRTADYDVSPGELMTLLDRTVEAVRPLYDDLHCWARAALASRYGRPMPKMLPAHWLANPWGQTWGELVQAHDLAPYFKGAAPTTLLESAERFYTSLGFPSLPASFWRASDPYPAPPQEGRLKNNEPSAWHIDRDQDVRVLMNVTPNERWFETAHHELAHVYYFLSYARPGVPWLLRQGPNRSFHEAIAELARLASQQDPYLKRIGVLPANVKRPPMETLLAQALEAVVPLPFSAGVMSHFERDFYETELPPEAWQQRWWDYVALYQGIEPPAPRETGLCDACTKPHLSGAPAQYYDFTLVTLTKFQLHEHICTKILHQDVHACDYGGHKEVGAFLRGLWAVGATRDWRELIEEATGEPLGAGALLRFFSPLAEELRRRNAGRNCQR
jgi:peptidyl-dipeptidase A